MPPRDAGGNVGNAAAPAERGDHWLNPCHDRGTRGRSRRIVRATTQARTAGPTAPTESSPPRPPHPVPCSVDLQGRRQHFQRLIMPAWPNGKFRLAATSLRSSSGQAAGYWPGILGSGVTFTGGASSESRPIRTLKTRSPQAVSEASASRKVSDVPHGSRSEKREG